MKNNFEYANNLSIAIDVLEKRRKDLNLTKRALAKNIDVKEATLNRYFRGDSIMTLKVYFDLCEALGLKSILVNKEENIMIVSDIKSVYDGL